MSKRAEEAALKAYPDKEVNGVSLVFSEQRRLFQEGYEQAEKDTIERVVEWLQGHSNDYIFRDVYMGKEELKISSQMFEDLKKAMEGDE
jgi:hypothetical protein